MFSYLLDIIYVLKNKKCEINILKYYICIIFKVAVVTNLRKHVIFKRINEVQRNFNFFIEKLLQKYRK